LEGSLQRTLRLAIAYATAAAKPCTYRKSQ
jgi:hypothetical protein